MEKYAPEKLEDIAGNQVALEEIRRWVLLWMKGEAQKPLLIWGPSGSGKSAIVKALAKEFEFEVVELEADNIRRMGKEDRILDALGMCGGLFGRRRLILMEDVDAVFGEDEEFLDIARKIVISAQQPIILTAEDAYERKLSNIRNECVKVQLKKINSNAIFRVLERISRMENIEIEREHIQRLANLADGDLRGAINDLEAKNFSSERNRRRNIFDSVREIFRARSYEEGRKKVFECEETRDMLKLWVDENIPIEYKTIDGVASAFNVLSRADVFDGRVLLRQYWGYLRYSADLLGAGISLLNPEKGSGFLVYAFPTYLKKMSETKARREIKKRILDKIRRKVHGSRKKSSAYFELVKVQLSKDPPSVSDFYGFEYDEVAFLLGKSEAEAKKLFNKTKQGQEG
ncbi:MAG: AAA family ATPase [Candidatus Anstonellales archaeon]